MTLPTLRGEQQIDYGQDHLRIRFAEGILLEGDTGQVLVARNEVPRTCRGEYHRIPPR